MRVREIFPDPARRLDEVDAVIVVFLKARRDRENVRIEDDIFRREADLLDENVVGAFADFGLALIGVGLSGFVERHHHHGRAVPARDAGFVQEFLLAFLERDRVHHRLALQAFQPGLDHGEL